VVAMAPFARDVIQELLRQDAPPAIRLKAAHAILRLATGTGF